MKKAAVVLRVARKSALYLLNQAGTRGVSVITSWYSGMQVWPVKTGMICWSKRDQGWALWGSGHASRHPGLLAELLVKDVPPSADVQ